MERRLMICLGVVAAGLLVHTWFIKELIESNNKLVDVVNGFREAAFQEVVDEMFEEIVEKFED